MYVFIYKLCSTGITVRCSYIVKDFNGGPQLDFEGVVAFLNETQSFMDGTEWVERYSWFGVMVNPPDVDIVSDRLFLAVLRTLIQRD